MRLFIASPVLLYDYTSIRREFASCLEGRWVEERNLHLTWVFLGERRTAEPILKAMASLSPLPCPVLLKSLDLLGRSPRIFHTLSRDRRLNSTARQFSDAGFRLLRFHPHVTLCRIRKINDRERFYELKNVYRGKITGMILPEILLYESRLTPEGPIYRELARVGSQTGHSSVSVVVKTEE